MVKRANFRLVAKPDKLRYMWVTYTQVFGEQIFKKRVVCKLAKGDSYLPQMNAEKR
jgi:hypothetical protein